jgi:3-methyladenine DNA glycosylase Tag
MSLPLIRKPFIVQGLAFTIAVFMMNNAQAASEQEQIQQLRDEVKELRALLEQYVPQSKQKNNVPQYDTQRSTTVASVSTQNISSNTQKRLKNRL